MKRVLSICLFLLLFLFACSEQEQEKENDDQGEEVANQPQTEEQQEQEETVSSEQEEMIEQEQQQDEADKDKQPKYVLNSKTWAVEPIDNDTNEQVVLLTIDDAPDTYALDMAKTLEKIDAPAIFFVNGHFLETPEQKETLQTIHEMGFAIGNHTYSHPQLPDLSEEDQREEIIQVNDMVESIIGERPKYFRAPFGANTDFSKQLAADEGMILMNWSYGYDWNEQYTTKEALTDIMVNAPELTNGANLLMHDREWTAAALENIVIGLRDKGYEMVDPALIQAE